MLDDRATAIIEKMLVLYGITKTKKMVSSLYASGKIPLGCKKKLERYLESNCMLTYTEKGCNIVHRAKGEYLNANV